MHVNQEISVTVKENCCACEWPECLDNWGTHNGSEK